MTLLICGILKQQQQTQIHRHREQIGGCQRLGGWVGEWAKWVKEVTKHKLPVVKYKSRGDVIYSMVTIVNKTVLYI